MIGKSNLKKISKIVNIRFLAIILVVLAHSIIIYKAEWGYYNAGTECELFNFITNLIYIFHMPLFFSISGYLFIVNCKEKYNLKKIIHKKFKRLIVPAIIVGLFYVLPIRYLCQYPPYEDNSLLYNIFFNIILGLDNGHLWYCYSLFIIFILSYFIENLNNKYLKVFIVLIISSIGQFIPTFVGSALNNLIWFYLGFLIKKINFNKSYKISLSLISILSIIIYFVCYYNEPLYYNYILISLKYIACITIIPLIYNIIPNKNNSLIEKVSDNSYGIYLFHSPLIYITFAFFSNLNPVLILLVNFVFFGIIAYAISNKIKKSKFKFILGG